MDNYKLNQTEVEGECSILLKMFGKSTLNQ